MRELESKLITDAIVFVTADLVALSVQGVGGNLAAIAAGNHKDPEKGGKTMLGGIVFQMFAITIYMVLAIEFVYWFLHSKPFKSRNDVPPSGCYTLGHNMKLMLVEYTSGVSNELNLIPMR
jgi:hypothetical protein